MWFTLPPTDLLEAPTLPFCFELEAVIQAAPAQVFSVLSDPSTWPIWYGDMKSATWTSQRPRGVGSVRQVELGLLAARERFLIWQPGRRLAFTITELSLPLVRRLVEDFSLRPTSTGATCVTWRVHYEPKWFLRPLHPLLRLFFGRQFARSLEGLSDFLRRSAPAPVARAA